MSQKQENPLLSIALNILIPSFVLMKLSDPERLGPVWGVVIALLFPIGYGLYDFMDRKKVNVISILGLVSVFLTGVFTIIELPPEWIAIKEAAIPGIIGITILLSTFSRYPLVKKFLLNEAIMNVELVHETLKQKANETAFEQLLKRSSLLLSTSFFLSAFLNYALAKYLLVAEPGTTEFNQQLGQMTAYSWPVIVLPSTLVMGIALWQLVGGIKRLTGLELEQILKTQPAKPD